MDIDERLERLVERHEALTESVELLRGTVDELVKATTTDALNIRALIRLSEMHERRLTDLEEEK